MTLLKALPLLPVLAVQGLRVRRTTPRLPEAPGPRHGVVAGSAQPYRVAVLGESTAAGVGADAMDDSLAPHLARELNRRSGREVRWQVAGRSGATARRTIEELAGQVEAADLVVVVLGINDLLELTRLAAFERDLAELLAMIDAPQMIVTGVPPVDRFPTLPQPLRRIMGERARDLDRIMAKVAGERHAPMELPMEAATIFASDGFHPSGQGYALWAEQLATRPLTGL
ncbi:SGNH/GDSL hydrolase family protein [Nonomuraea sp. NBC_01738]|uniref:SGNH/GDSL hydrolase family protein n=1 Tax=Nonomuraea sp. NBC_01738 TaxID=2976003 RepID=UPI002E10AC54|nr:SGNH/GDSL hydrolase family protein [Nonomuraea sp. NBC_01738]